MPSSSVAKVSNSGSKEYDNIWNTIFETDHFLKSGSRHCANIILFGADLDILSGIKKSLAQPHVMLAVSDYSGDVYDENKEKKLLRSSLRETYNSPEESQLKKLTLTVGRLDVPEVLGQDFRYLFSNNRGKLETKYCYWNDPEKKIRKLETQDIRGIGGPITEAKNLRPIFLLYLRPPVQYRLGRKAPERKATPKPEQFIFRSFRGASFWTGFPPIVDTINGEKLDNGEYTFRGFQFKNKKYKKYYRQKTDWIKIAEIKTGYRYDEIDTL